METETLPYERGDIEASCAYFLKHNLNKSLRLLDIGCKYGSFIRNIYKSGYYNVYGIDINKEVVEKGRYMPPHMGDKIILYEGKVLPFKDNSFDVITMWDTIEHIADIEVFIKGQVHRCLRPGGYFIFQTPNKYINIVWEIVQTRDIYSWRHYHCSLQTKRSLESLLKRVGFLNIKTEKQTTLSQYNNAKVRKKLGRFGVFLLQLCDKVPLEMSPNLWGSARKEAKVYLGHK